MKTQAIVAALEAEEALIAGALCDTKVKRCGHAGHCAIGALLFHAGMSNKELKECPYEESAIWSNAKPHGVYDWDQYATVTKPADPIAKKAKDILTKVYGLTRDQIGKIIVYNDGSDDGNTSIACGAKIAGASVNSKLGTTQRDKYRALGVIAFIKAGLKQPKVCK